MKETRTATVPTDTAPWTRPSLSGRLYAVAASALAFLYVVGLTAGAFGALITHGGAVAPNPDAADPHQSSSPSRLVPAMESLGGRPRRGGPAAGRRSPDRNDHLPCLTRH